MRRREAEAELFIGDLPRKLPRASHIDLRRAFAQTHQEIDDKLVPHPDYIEAKLQQKRNNNAPPLVVFVLVLD